MPGPLELKGIAASPGYAAGPVFDLDRPLGAYAAKSSIAAEKAALDAGGSVTAAIRHQPRPWHPAGAAQR